MKNTDKKNWRNIERGERKQKTHNKKLTGSHSTPHYALKPEAYRVIL
jgi:hypothetical protein